MKALFTLKKIYRFKELDLLYRKNKIEKKLNLISKDIEQIYFVIEVERSNAQQNGIGIIFLYSYIDAEKNKIEELYKESHVLKSKLAEILLLIKENYIQKKKSEHLYNKKMLEKEYQTSRLNLIQENEIASSKYLEDEGTILLLDRRLYR